jgi:hypothetical protein
VNDLDYIHRVGVELDEVEGDTLSPAVRGRLVNGFAGRASAGSTSHSRRFRARWIVAAASAAAACLAVVAVGGTIGDGSRDRQSSSPRVQPAATGVLHNAALAAYSTGTGVAAAGTVVFTETVRGYGMRVEQPDGSFKADPARLVVQQLWLPTDGRSAGAMRTRPYAETAAWSELMPLDATGEAMADVPATAEGLLQWLGQLDGQTVPDPTGAPASTVLFQRAVELLIGGGWLTPAQRAAVFEALSTLPDLVVAHDAHDLAGRGGIGVQAPGEIMLVFDVSTYALLGTPKTGLLRQSLVDQIAQEP